MLAGRRQQQFGGVPALDGQQRTCYPSQMHARLSAIDGLRGVAITAVIFEHVYGAGVAGFLSRHGLAPHLVRDGWLGVGLFFVLSGFVLALPYFEKRRELLISEFYARRARRLLPLMWITATVALLIVGLSSPGAIKSYLLTVTTLNMFTWDNFLPQINVPLWTISIEIWFSILFPFIMMLAARYGVCQIVISSLVVALIVRYLGSDIQHLFYGISPVKDSVLGRIDEFIIGMGVARLYAAGRLKHVSGLVGVAGLALVVLAALGWDAIAAGTLPNAPLNVVLHLFASIGFAMIIAVCLSDKSRAAFVLSAWPLRLAGAMCYSLYVWHYLLVRVTGIINDRADPLANILFWSGLLTISFLSYRFIEFPNRPVVALLLFERGRSKNLAPTKSSVTRPHY